MAACLTSLLAAVTGPLLDVKVTGLEEDPKFFEYTPDIASSNVLVNVLFVVVPHELDCSPDPINSVFNLVEYVDAIMLPLARQ